MTGLNRHDRSPKDDETDNDPAFAPPPGYPSATDVDLDEFDADELEDWETDDLEADAPESDELDGDAAIDEVTDPPSESVGEWDGHHDLTATLVDGVATPDISPTSLESDGLPLIVPMWVRSRVGRRTAMRRAVARRWHWTRFHTVRLPAYWWRLALRSPRGLWRAFTKIARFTADAEGRESIAAVRSSASPDAKGDLARAEAEHWDRIKGRLLVDAVGFLFGIVAVVVWLLVAPWYINLASFVIVAAMLGASGAPEHARPIVERVIYKGQAIEAPSQDLVTRSLADALPAVARALKEHHQALVWRQPPTLLETGAGYRMVVELPGGVTVEDAVKARQAVAGGLSRDAACLAIEQVPAEKGGHARMAALTVLDVPMRATPPAAWPLAVPTAGPVDVFEPVPLGVDLTGRTVAIDLMFRSAVVGAQPRVGKTFAVRVAALAAALDPRAELHIFDLKGGVDFSALGVNQDPGNGVIHSGVSSLRPEIAGPALLDTVRYLTRDLRRRSDVIGSLTVEECPEGRVTTELADQRTLGLHPAFLIIDETQFAFDGGWGSDITAEIKDKITQLAKAGPSYGICVWLASQQVNEMTIPRSISTMAGLRFCLSVADHNEANLILGGGATKRGYRPDHLTLDDKGIGYLSGEGAEPRLMRTFFVDGTTAPKIAARARHLRQQAGRLTGHAAGETTEPETQPSVLDDLAGVWLAGRTGSASAVHLDTLAGLLAERWPGRYDRWDSRTLGQAARAAGCQTQPVSGVRLDGTRTSGQQGIKHPHLLAAIDTQANNTIEEDTDTGHVGLEVVR